MNAHHDELERMLGRDLRRQVDGMVEVPFGLQEVRGRAGRIRRNRRIAAGVGVAAALAVIVPTAIAGGGLLQGTQEIQPAPSPSRSVSPSPSPTSDAPVEVARTTLTLDGLVRGDAPAIEYFTPEGVVLPGEGTRELPENYQALVPGTGDGWIALGPARDEVVYLTGGFEQQGGSPSGNSFVTTPGRDYVAWTTPEPGAQTVSVRSTSDADDVTSWDFPERPAVEPVGILGPNRVVYELPEQGGAGVANPDGTTSELPYLGAQAADPVNGLIAVQTESRSASGCFGVVDAATFDLAWDTCDYALGTFSPDGSYVMASSADGDGLGPTALYVLDARTGELVAEFASQGRTMVQLVFPAWESPDSVVALAMQGDTQTLVRLRVDGGLEQVADAVDGRDYGDLFYSFGADRAGL